MAVYADVSHDARVQREAAALAMAGYRVTVLSLPGGEVPDLGSRIDWRSFQPRWSQVRPGSASPYATPGSTHSAVGRLGWVIAYVANLKAWGRWAMKEVEADIWHAHDLPALEAISPVLDKVTSVYDSHELYLEAGTPARLPNVVRRLLRWRESRLISRVDAVITVNPSIERELADRYGAKATVVMNCPPRPSVRAAGVMRRTLGLGNRPIVMYHGGVSPDRGIEAMLHAMPLLPESVYFVILGDGSLVGVDDGDVRERVRRHPAVPVDELATWLVDADVGLVLFAPVELNNILATPNKLFEYMSAAVPVVVSRFPELERIVTETGCGITADPTQPNDVAAAIRSLLADDGRRRELGRNGFVAAQDRYNWEVQAERLVGVYRDLPSPAVDQPDASVAIRSSYCLCSARVASEVLCHRSEKAPWKRRQVSATVITCSRAVSEATPR